MRPFTYAGKIRSVRKLWAIAENHYSSFVKWLRGRKHVPKPHLVIGFGNPCVEGIPIQTMHGTYAREELELDSCEYIWGYSYTQGPHHLGNTRQSLRRICRRTSIVNHGRLMLGFCAFRMANLLSQHTHRTDWQRIWQVFRYLEWPKKTSLLWYTLRREPLQLWETRISLSMRESPSRGRS